MRNLLLFGFLAAFIALCAGKSAELGQKAHDDLLLRREILTKDSSFMRKQVGKYEFPPSGTINNHEITYINIIDQTPYEGYVQVTGGGLGYKSAAFKLKSQRSKGYNFILEIYGRRFPS